MQSVTLAVAIAGILAVLYLKPEKALALFIGLLFTYPDYLVVAMGTVEVSVSRLVITALFVRCLFTDSIRSRFSWQKLDTWVSATIIIDFLIMLMYPISLGEVIENRVGLMMDTWIAYMVARLCITRQSQMVSFAKWIAVILSVAAILAILESLTGFQPYAGLRKYSPYRPDADMTKEPRLGFNRAVGAFSHSIMLGVSFAMFLPLVFWLRHQKGAWKDMGVVCAVCLLLGTISSMSSGPWVMAIVITAGLLLWYNRKLLKPLLVVFLLGCLLTSIVSNRPFYHVVVTYANPVGGTGWHRAKLIDCAIGSFSEWWLRGYLDKDPGWGPQLGMAWTDVTNQFILEGVRFGLAGMIAYCGKLVVAIRGIIKQFKSVRSPMMRSNLWGFGVVLVAVIIVWFSVNFFGPPTTIYYVILGLVGSMISGYFIPDGEMGRIEKGGQGPSDRGGRGSGSTKSV